MSVVTRKTDSNYNAEKQIVLPSQSNRETSSDGVEVLEEKEGSNEAESVPQGTVKPVQSTGTAQEKKNEKDVEESIGQTCCQSCSLEDGAGKNIEAWLKNRV